MWSLAGKRLAPATMLHKRERGNKRPLLASAATPAPRGMPAAWEKSVAFLDQEFGCC